MVKSFIDLRSHLRTLHTDLTPQPPSLLALGKRSIHAIAPGKLGMQSL
ncbi:hypothetical protein [Nostoc sp.]